MTPTDPSAHHYTDAEMHNEEVAYEHSDINLRALVSFAVGLAFVVAASSVLVLFLFKGLEWQASGRDPQLSPLAPPSGQQPTGPRLLTDEAGYLRTVRGEERQKLESYGWVDQRGGIAHVPIEEAKKLLLQHGVPVRAGTGEHPREGTHEQAYGESSGGRSIPVSTPPPQPPPAPSAPAPQGEVKK